VPENGTLVSHGIYYSVEDYLMANNNIKIKTKSIKYVRDLLSHIPRLAASLVLFFFSALTTSPVFMETVPGAAHVGKAVTHRVEQKQRGHVMFTNETKKRM